MESGRSAISAAGLREAARGLAGALSPARRSVRPLVPVAVVAAVLVVILGVRLNVDHGNPTAFIQFGRQFAPYTRPPAGAVLNSRFGYDGQFYWIQARDPLLLHGTTLAELDATGRGYDLQRMAYPLLAAAVSLGQAGAIPWAMLAINVIAILALTGAVAAYARSLGRSAWWGLAAGLTPGLVMGTLRDLSDPLATAAMIGGLVAYERGRRWPAAGLLALAALAREPMIVAVAAVGADIIWSLWRRRSGVRAVRRAPLRAWPVVVIPILLFAGWQVYIKGLSVTPVAATPRAAHVVRGPTARAPTGSDTFNLPPGRDFRDEIRRSVRDDSGGAAAWDIAYIAVLIAAIVAALLSLRRGLLAPTIAALLSGLVVSVVFLGDQWGISRYGAPVFGALLISGLRTGLRGPLRICALAALLTAFVPIVIAGG